MKMDARRMLAHLLDRKGKNRGRKVGDVGTGPGRLSRSEPAIHALGPDLTRRPLNNTITRGITSGVGNETPSSSLASLPPPPLPTYPPPPVPPHAQPLPQPPMQPLPPLPSHQQEDHRYQLEEDRYQQQASLQAPGTCILPRRSLEKEVNIRYRSPSNPPPASRQPPPYSRHQPPEPHGRPRGPYQPPPPPKADFRNSRDHRESRPREVRSSVNLDQLLDCRSRRDHWAEGDTCGGPKQQDGQKNCNFKDVRDTWEKRNSAIVSQEQSEDDNLRSSSLPRPKPETWLPPNNRWSTRNPDSGFDSLNLQAADDGQQCSEPGQSSHNRAPLMLPTDAHYSQSTEDLLNASRTSPMSLSSATASMSSTSSSPVQYPTIRPAKQPCLTGASHTSPFSHISPRCSPHPPGRSPRSIGSPHHHSTPVGPQRTASPEGALLSDSVYPQHDTQPRYAEIQDRTEPKTKEENLSHRLSHDLRNIRDVRELEGNRESREPSKTGSDLREPCNNRSSRELRQNKDMKSREYRETSLPRDFRNSREERLPRDVATKGFRELPVDVDEQDQLELRQDRLRGPREGRPNNEGSKEVRFRRDASESLQVRDVPSLDRRDRDGDGADGLQVNDERHLSSHQRDHRTQRGDGCTSSSVSWMEWTQQLQAYVAWVNSQLRKRGRPLISDLRRDLQSGVVFADLIEIISAGERVSGIQRERERETITPQAMKENLDRILQFMAAKRIRMTHITSKEVAEGNLKSIMRVILALAAHYKPQSVKAALLHQQETTPAAPTCTTTKYPVTHEVSVGPDGPAGCPEKTPNLSTNRRGIVTGGSSDDHGAMPNLKRHPSMTATPGAPLDSSPVYENLPRRGAPSRWAYDSLRASYKFQWSGPQSRHLGPASGLNRPSLDESSDDPLNTSLTISLNTSVEGEVEPSSPGLDSSGERGSGRPAALNFWKDLTNQRDPTASQHKCQPTEPPHTPSEDDDNPFRYHTIHRMSGRRKLPQIPGAPNPGSRVTTPQEAPESPRDAVNSNSLNDHVEGKPVGGSALAEEGSREPEGRSQNSSPATSLVRGHMLEQWPREKPQMDTWDTSDLKSVLRDLNNTRDQLLALQHLELDPASRDGQGLRSSELLEVSTASVKQELMHLTLARRALEAEKTDLTRLLEQREGVITELRKQMHQQDKAMHTQRAQFEDTLKNVQNGKRAGGHGDSPAGRGGPREELHLVRDAIASLRSNFRETDPNQHTLDTLEQAISILIERSSNSNNSFGGGGSCNDKNSLSSDHHQMNGMQEASTKVIYFTERTVTPFMSTINKRLGEIRLRDFKNMFDRPGLFRFHFKSYDLEYGMVKEEIVNEDDILPGVEGKIIAWVEEDVE